jgi:lipopolysaccharide/colanic/teichoic acid biosynthesis glycosyltransferase
MSTTISAWHLDAEFALTPVAKASPPRRVMLRVRLQSLLIVMDVFAIAVAILVASLIWFGNVESGVVTPLFAAIIPLYLWLSFNSGAFGSEVLMSYRRLSIKALRALVLTFSAVVIAAFFLKVGGDISRMEVFLASTLATLFVLCARSVMCWRVRRSYPDGLRSEIMIVDDVPLDVATSMFVIDASAAGLCCDLRDPFMLDKLGRLVANADRVIVACTFERRRSWAMMLKGANIQGEVLAPELGELGPLGIGQMGDGPTITVSTGMLALRQRLLKRVLDLAICSLVLVTSTPLLLIVAIAIKLESRGPVFFVQPRVGRGNQMFNLLKYRSMYVDECDVDGGQSTGRGDARVTRIGRIIRATSIDELPQLLNVFMGQMSIVGPRPHALGSLAGNALFWDIDERYWHRHVCKPGLTGMAQVRGLRGATHRRTDLVNRLQADLEYCAGWTIWRDFLIIIATLRVIVHRNAY